MGAQRLLLTRVPSPGSGLGCRRSLGSSEGLERTVGCRGSSSAMGCQRHPCSASTAGVGPGTRALTKPLACEPDCVRLVKINDVAQNTLPGEGCRDLPGLVRQFRRAAGGSRGRERRMPSAEVGLQFKRVRRPTRRKRDALQARNLLDLAGAAVCGVGPGVSGARLPRAQRRRGFVSPELFVLI